MDLTVLLFLFQDGVINGAVYALVALALVLVFAVTRVILVSQGEFVAFAALTVSALENGRAPGTIWLLITMGLLAAASEIVLFRKDLGIGRLCRIAAFDIALPVGLAFLTWTVAPLKLGTFANSVVAILLILPMGSMLYRIAFQPIATASVLVLLIAAFGVHFSLMGVGLLFFGPEGVGTTPFSAESFSLGTLVVSAQSILVVCVTLIALSVFAGFFNWTIFGKALRASASNRVGARLSGIPVELAGQAAFTIAAGLGAVSGVLVGPLTTMYYDSGFLIGLKGFVAAILGGLVSFPLTVIAALVVGFAESMFSFWASSFKEVLVFSLIVPILLWRSLYSTSGGHG
ncbi:branched-chain amino acid ABC transporter permease [Tardiphaga alba]|uniref:Branched-chain amino acid ABC transporter permease n=1 Tax=Tardiphaga alba TaxID=340268 RepID=A0ABX8AJ96_9BRAD|nr:branched-chain amino acid ABC transporter permease [Tardiphaga alba]QUS42420.1 branched-chain amino acid ABC transporter permease [Tardiphaga alba]